MRHLATIREIVEIRPIEGADAIDAARVDGWWVVVKRDEFKVGQKALYVEVDAWVPHEIAPFLAKGQEPKVYEGVRGNRLRTIRLRGQLSQGLLLPTKLPASTSDAALGVISQDFSDSDVGADVTELLGIIKWEPQIPACLAGKVRGTFPGWARKTDQERIQNCFGQVQPMFGLWWTQEEKLDGSSMTVAKREDDVHVCSRNLSIKLDDESNSFVRVAKESGILEALEKYGRNLAVSGELCGPGIQKNRYKLATHQWFLFDIYDVDTGSYVSVDDRQRIIQDLAALGATLQQVPCKQVNVTLVGKTCDDFLQAAEGKSALCLTTEREGDVYKCVDDPNVTFKAISNRYLAQEE